LNGSGKWLIDLSNEMAKNDRILLDGIIDARLNQGYPSQKRDEVFEFFCFEQLLKDFELSRDELEAGWVDGRDDGGIDGFYIFVNGLLLGDTSDFPWPRTRTEIVVYIVTCKHHETFQQPPLNALVASLQELLDFSLDPREFKGAYSEDLVNARQNLFYAYRRLSTTNPSLKFCFSYISRGDSGQVASNVNARADQLVTMTQQLFSASITNFSFLGASELVALHRRIRSFSLELGYSEMLSRERASYACLVPLDHYFKFVTDERGAIRRYLFESNVRDYLGGTAVNEDILASLLDLSSPDFWWLNNGVTILASKASAMGKILLMEDVQIVNGLQTTETIYRYFQLEGASAQNRCVLVRVLVSSDPVVRDRIIRATNNQTLVETAALRATDKIQRDIEDVLERHEWYYERRKNYYRNIGRPPSRFVTPLYLAGGVVAILLRDPVRAATIRARFMRNDASYQKIFSESTPLLTWVRIVDVLKRTESVIARSRATHSHSHDGDRFSARWRGLLGLLCVARMLGTFGYGPQQVAEIDLSGVSDQFIEELWAIVQNHRESKISFKPSSKDYCNKKLLIEIIDSTAEQFNIKAVEAVRKQHHAKPTRLDSAFLDAVNAILPEQPWRPGIHRIVAKQLGCEPHRVSYAINVLMKTGRRIQQKDGVLYTADGKVIDVVPSKNNAD
jgi:hypothetical protein